MTYSEGFFLFDSRFLWPFATPAKADWRQSEVLMKTCTRAITCRGRQPVMPRRHNNKDRPGNLRHFVDFIGR
jgi:hypothetical protein